MVATGSVDESTPETQRVQATVLTDTTPGGTNPKNDGNGTDDIGGNGGARDNDDGGGDKAQLDADGDASLVADSKAIASSSVMPEGDNDDGDSSPQS